jgi:hypothetical protein
VLQIDDLLQMLAPSGLTVEVLFDVVGLDLQLVADVEKERQWHAVLPLRWPAGRTKQAELNRESAAFGIAAAAIDTEQILVG